MKHPNIFKTFLLGLSMLGILPACNKESKNVTPEASNLGGEIQIVAGRIVFKDYDSYKNLIEKLDKKNESELASWEKPLSFSSLRNSSGTKQQALKEEFGFPNSISTVLNSKGEYQIGKDFFWYHEGKKHLFKSEADMLAAENGNKIAHKILLAGYKIVDAAVAKPSGSASRLYQNDGSGVDARWQYQFNLWYQSACVRKIVYETIVYTEQDDYNYTYYSALVLRTKLEWQRSDGAWRVAGEDRIVDFEVSGYADAFTTDGGAQLTPDANNYYVKDRVSGGTDSQRTLSSVNAMSANVYNSNNIIWNYSVNGRISSWVTSDADHTYTIQGADLW